MAPLVNENGCFAEKVTPADATLVTFYNRELSKAYNNLKLQIEASNRMAERTGRVAYELDGEIDLDAAATDDSVGRWVKAAGSARCLYPLVIAGGQHSGIPIVEYRTFQTWIQTYLRVYKEFFLRGEVVCGEPSKDDAPILFTFVDDKGISYRVRGAQQRNTYELQGDFWSRQLALLNLSTINERVKSSREARSEMEKKKQKERNRSRAKAVAAAKAAKNVKDVAIKKAKKASNHSKGKAVLKKSDIRKTPKRKGKDSTGNSKRTTASHETVPSEGRSGGRKNCTIGNASSKRNGTTETETAISDESADDSESQGAMPADSIGTGSMEVDPRQVRSPDFDYTLLTEAQTDTYLSSVMVQPGLVPQTKTMYDEICRPDAKNDINQFVSVKTSSGFTYTDISSLTSNLHGKQNEEQRKLCRDEAEKRGISNLSIPGGSSYMSHDVNVLYPGTQRHNDLAKGVNVDVGAIVQGISQVIDSGDFNAKYLADRRNVQFTVGISDRNYDEAKPAEAGEVAALDVQNKKRLHKYFPNRGKDLGMALVELARIRDTLAQERGSNEYNDTIRNQLFGERAGRIFGLPTLGFENSTALLTGRSRTLEGMVEKIIKKLPPCQRDRERILWFTDGAVDTKDHGDQKNPKELEYSRVALGKWRIRLKADREDDFLDVTLIGNHRQSVATYEDKMKGIRKLSDWIKDKFEKRAAETGHISYDADGDFLATGASVLRVGFLEEEKECVTDDSCAKYGPGCFVSYSRPTSALSNSWLRHRKTMLQKDTPQREQRHSKKRNELQ